MLRLLCASLVTVLPVALAGSTEPPQRPADQPKPEQGSVAITGCVAGDTLTSVSPDTVDSASVLVAGRTYRLTGNRRLLNQIRRQHDGHLLEVIGKIKGGAEPAMVVHRKKLGKTAVYVGQGKTAISPPPSGPELPTLAVEGMRLIQTNCPRSNLGR